MFSFFKKPILPEVTSEIDDRINELAVPFGSRIWGGASKNSDYDYVITSVACQQIKQLLKVNNIKYDRQGSYRAVLDNDSEITFKINGKKYQLLVFNYGDDYKAFVRSIQYTSLYATAPIVNKKDRCSIFCNFRYFVDNNRLPGDPAIGTFLKANHPELLV